MHADNLCTMATQPPNAGTQQAEILKYLQAVESATTSEISRALGVAVVVARVFELKKRGYHIINETAGRRGREARYKLLA